MIWKLAIGNQTIALTLSMNVVAALFCNAFFIRKSNMASLSSFQKGKRGEEKAREYLQKIGYRILASNYKALGAEIDIIAQDGKELVVVEVKGRNHEDESLHDIVNDHKRHQIERAVQAFLVCNKLSHMSVRFEVVVIIFSLNELRHFREEFFDF